MIDKVFHNLTVVGKTDLRRQGAVVWECKCSCGNTTKASTGDLTSGNTKSCGCLKSPNLKDRVFGQLTVLYLDGKIGHHRAWMCKCSCGGLKRVAHGRLTSKATTSCGCARGKSQLLPNGLGQKRYIFRQYKSWALKKGRKFELGFESFVELISSACHYCSHSAEQAGSTSGFNGIDRMDNSKGYVTGNVVSCCWPCNQMKGSRSHDGFIDHCSRIAGFRVSFLQGRI